MNRIDKVVVFRYLKDHLRQILDVELQAVQDCIMQLSQTKDPQNLPRAFGEVNKGVLETFVVSVAETAEDLIRFKWGRLAQSLFALKHRKVNLLEGELTVPRY